MIVAFFNMATPIKLSAACLAVADALWVFNHLRLALLETLSFGYTQRQSLSHFFL